VQRWSTTDPRSIRQTGGAAFARAAIDENNKISHSMTAFAFVFPGQGSQSVGMLDAWGDHPAVLSTLQEASAALGEDVGRLIHEGPKEQLDLTTNTQPVMLTAGIAAYRAWCAEGGAAPAAVAGHSLGEYAALVAAGVLTLADALPLVRLRATAMQEAVPVGAGAMAAILGLDAQAVQDGCKAAAQASGEVVEAVNFNDPKQTVIAGSKAGVDKACEMLKAAGAKRALLLAVSAPFHSSLMKPAAERLRLALEKVTLHAPAIPVVNNVDVATPADAAAIRDALVRQAAGPVRWVEVVQSLKARGMTHVVECGPGKVLAGMVKRIDAELVTGTIHDPASLNEVKGLLA
jgi:[acyl-carrier-protein] S-malonyltransferase